MPNMQAQAKDIIAVFDAKQGNKTGAIIAKGTTFEYVEKSGTWLRLPNNLWVNGGANWQYIRLLPDVVIPPVDPPDDEEPPIPDVPPVGDKPRGEGTFIVVKNSMQVYGVSRPAVINKLTNEIGYPDMWAIKPETSQHPMLPPYWGKAKNHFTFMTHEICHWMFRVNIEMYEDMTFKSDAEYMQFFNALPKTHQYILWWKNLTRGNGSHTNTKGSDTCYDPISGENQGKELMRWFQVLTGGFIGKINAVRSEYYKIDCIKGTGNFKLSHPRTRPYEWDVPLITFREKVLVNGNWDGKTWRHITRHYGQFGGYPYLPVMLPFDDKCLIAKSICRILDPYEPTPNKFG